MKPGLLITIALIALIAIAASFGLHIYPTAPLFNLPDSVADMALYVCPRADAIWDEIARMLWQIRTPLTMAFFFGFLICVAIFAWAFYQAFLKDKIEEKNFKTGIFLAKMLGWAALIFTILIWSPNWFRTVHLRGAEGEYVLCEMNTPGARPVRADAVMSRVQIRP
ncbi:MAG: hypothetical protein LBR41_00170 [Rickettsiales bacterium]|jgi:hypothetical protein|nr:hypothetical protein [Rickettsiales bacterium]